MLMGVLQIFYTFVCETPVCPIHNQLLTLGMMWCLRVSYPSCARGWSDHRSMDNRFIIAGLFPHCFSVATLRLVVTIVLSPLAAWMR